MQKATLKYQNSFDYFYNCFLQTVELSNQGKLQAPVEANSNDIFIDKISRYFFSAFHQPNTTKAIPYWSSTCLAKNQYHTVIKLIEERITQINISPYKIPKILDIGCGDGTLTVMILEKIRELCNCEKIEVVLIDPDAESIKIAGNKLDQLSWISFTPIQKPFNLELLSNLLSNEYFELVNASSILHEFPYYEKERILTKLFAVAKNVIVTELEGDHDLILSQSKQLVKTAFFFYKNLFDCIVPDKADPDFESFIYGYIFPEFSDILFKNYKNRRNYHLDLPRWQNLYKISGWNYYSTLTPTNICGFNFFTSHLFCETNN